MDPTIRYTKAPDIEAGEHFNAPTSISGAFFSKAKIDKIFVDFYFAKAVNYFSFSIISIIKKIKQKNN